MEGKDCEINELKVKFDSGESRAVLRMMKQVLFDELDMERKTEQKLRSEAGVEAIFVKGSQNRLGRLVRPRGSHVVSEGSLSRGYISFRCSIGPALAVRGNSGGWYKRS
jgi:hypothetical protein